MVSLVLTFQREWVLFIEKYKDIADERRSSTRQQREEREASLETALQRTHENICCILTLYSSHNCLVTGEEEVSLSLKEAELLSFLALNEGGVFQNHKYSNTFGQSFLWIIQTQLW